MGNRALSFKREADQYKASPDFVWPDAGDVVVADLEYTSWEGALERGWSRPGEHREVVQIGAVRLDAGDRFAETGAIDILVRPVRNPVLSDYFVTLTGITNQRLDAEGTDLKAALGALVSFAGDAPILSNGADDAVIAESCALAGIENPLAALRWTDISAPLQMAVGVERVHSADIPALFGLPSSGPAHDALADARAVAAGLRHLRSQEKI